MTAPSKPRIVARTPDDHPATEADAADLQNDYAFFAFSGAERTEAIKKKIEEREKALFELEMLAAMLDGNPNPGQHMTEEERTRPTQDGKSVTYPCQCGVCELGRANDAIRGVVYGLGKLRALHARMVG